MATKIILNTTPPLDAIPIGFFITAEENDTDAQREKQIYVRFKVGLTNGGNFTQIGTTQVAIKDTLFNQFVAQQTLGGKSLAAELRDLTINFIIANNLLSGIAA